MKKRLIFIVLALAFAVSCAPKEFRVMARYVPERADDFVFENNLIAGRFYGEALEGNPTSPGIDVWVKLPGKLVANEWYEHATSGDGNYYHHDHGGKDCYKVAVSLGGGASSPLVNGKIAYPATNYRSWEILSEKPDEIVFVLNYPEWSVDSLKVALSKKVRVKPDTYFCEVEDTYTFNTEELTVAAGLLRHDVAQEILGDGVVALWEHASDQSVEPEDGMIGVAVVMSDS
ncbi:MAG: DUF4861 family protein, partial [Bacteroidales bacterium]|nr:DUF4861 family protein [Bacteroidales bacterium]